jgi:hypothetical protein
VVAAVVSAVTGAAVSVGNAGVDVKAAAVSVNCETTVPAAEVRMAATSDVGSCSGVFAEPQAATRIVRRSAVTISFGFIKPRETP